MSRGFYMALTISIVVIMVVAIVFTAERVYAKTVSTVVGQVVSMSTMDGTLTVKEDDTDKVHQLDAGMKGLKAAGIEEGYRIEIRKAGERATAIRVLGVPMKAEPESHQVIQMVREQ